MKQGKCTRRSVASLSGKIIGVHLLFLRGRGNLVLVVAAFPEKRVCIPRFTDTVPTDTSGTAAVVFLFYPYIICMVITYSKSKDQPGKVANPARGQLNMKNKYSPVPVRA